MQFRRHYTLPELLILLSLPQPRPELGRWRRRPPPRTALLRHLIRLAKEGLHEYQQKLERLERQVSHRPWERDEFPDEPDEDCQQQQLDDDTIDESYSRAEEAEERIPETRRLNRVEIQLLFATLATRRVRLNVRDYPYTSDVNEERERAFPASEPLEGEEVREAWDDWRNGRAKRLFRRCRRGPAGREARRGRERDDLEETDDREASENLEEPEDSDDSSDSEDSKDERGRREIEALERRPERGAREELEKVSDVLYATVKRAVQDFESERNPPEDIRDGFRDLDADRDEMQQPPAGEFLFQVFDEFLLSDEAVRCGFALGDLPDIREVNLRLVQRGESVLEHEDALRRGWSAYLVAAASARGARIRAARACGESGGTRRGNGSRADPDEVPIDSVEVEAVEVDSVVEIKTDAVGRQAFTASGRRKKWKPT